MDESAHPGRSWTKPSLVVGIGASIGELEALERLLPDLPSDHDLSFVLLIAPAEPARQGASQWSERLQPYTTMRVRTAEDGEALRPHTLYLVAPGAALASRDDRLVLSSTATLEHVRRPTDRLFGSLARELRSRGVGIVLAHDGRDGSEGLRELRAVGGLTIVGDRPAAGEPSSEPHANGGRGAAELALPLAEIPAALRRFARLSAEGGAELEPDADQTDLDASSALSEAQLTRLASAFDMAAAFDLRAYKPGTVERRVLRRMTLAGYDDVEDYLERLTHDALERRALAREMLISVTELFRDPDAFEVLRTTAIEPLVDAAVPGDTLRVWVPGCATGEEAYSIAIEILDAIERRGAPISLQLFATDLDEAALQVARAGTYSATSTEHVDPECLRKHFEPLDGKGHRVSPRLRDAVSFATHDLTRDPPFSRMNLVSCRNVLIYLRPKAQEHVLSLLGFALQPNGYLFLGSSESLGSQRRLFATRSKQWRIFQKLGQSAASPQPMVLPRREPLHVGSRGTGALPSTTREDPLAARGRRRIASSGDDVRRAVIRARVPPTLVVDEAGTVLFMHGELRPYLRFPDGDPRLELSSLVTPELATRVRSALFKCRRDIATVVVWSSPDANHPARIKVTATPAFELGDGVVILSFEDAEEPVHPPLALLPQGPSQEALIEQLERELLATREDLRSTVEELESSNEELRCSNEESMSINEELQSANEELEATSEELRSLNEELGTVNAQLREKVEQLEQAHDDLTNLFSSTKIATLFLDERLCIKRFTPAAEELVRVDDDHEGRFVGDIARELLQNDLVQEAQQVLAQLESQTRELRTGDGRWIIRRVLPYRTESRRIEGVVVTFVDVTDLKATAERLATRERQQAVIARLGLRALEEPDLQTFFDQAVRELQQALGSDFCKLLELQPGGKVMLLRAGVGWREGLIGQTTVGAEIDSQAGYTLKAQEPVVVDDLEHERRFGSPMLLLEHGVRSGLTCIIRGVEELYGAIGMHTRRPHAFTPEDAYFLQAATSVIAGAINRHETRARLALEGAVAKALIEAHHLPDLIQRFHAAAAEVLGAEVTELWEPSPDDGEVLERSMLLTSTPLDPKLIEQRLRPARFESDERGVPRRVHAQRRAEWVTSLQDTAQFARVAQARALGLCSCMALPIIGAADQSLGVVTLFSRRHLHADVVFLRSLESIGRSLGAFVQRLDVERRFSLTIDSAPVGIADRALDGRWLRVNPRLGDITGYTPEELIGRSFVDITHPDDVEREAELYAEVREGRSDGYQIEKRYVRKDGTTVWVSLKSSSVPKPSGELGYHVDIIEDISSRKLAEENLRRSEARFRQVLVSSPVPMMVHDDTGRIAALSNSWTEITGYSLDDIPTASEWFRQAFRERADEIIAERDELWNNEQSERSSELELWTKDGELKILRFQAVPLGTSSSGKKLRLISAVDVTQQRRFERELLEASRQKDEFIAMMGHELRNPLAAVSSATEILKQSVTNASLLGRVQAILERQTRHMAKLLDGLLDVSRVVRGQIKVDKRTIDLRVVVRDVLSDFASRPVPDGLELRVELTDDPLWVEVDVVRLTQVVENLLSNAIKYTPPPGTITVRLQPEGGAAVLSVRDTGTGIEPEFLPHLFEPFRQGRQNLDRAQGGIGIGLALVKQLVELHSGTVQARSEGPGHGAELEVRLPLVSMPPADARPRSPRSGQRRILVIEDNEDAAEMLRTALELRGHDVSVALRGATGIEHAREHTPEVVICDIGLPEGITGFDVAQALRADPRTRDIRLVALSGYARAEDRERSREAGFHAHLAKPVSLDQIDRVLQRLWDDEPSGEP